MSTYIIKELQNLNSERAGEIIQANSLASAKRIASKKQTFQGTVMRIENTQGSMIAYKQSGKWINA